MTGNLKGDCHTGDSYHRFAMTNNFRAAREAVKHRSLSYFSEFEKEDHYAPGICH